jgi:peptidylprolyl isomerase
MKQILVAAIGAATLITAASADPLEGKPTSAEILEATTPEDWRALDPENTLYIETERGRVVVALSTGLAQNHVAWVKTLAREKFYDGLTFYRVIEGFVAQGGDPFLTRGERDNIADEFDEAVGKDFAFYRMNDKDGYAGRAGFLDTLPVGYDKKEKRAWHLHCTGAIALGRENGRNSASTEFYVALQPQRYLDRNLSVFGRVVAGMEHLQALKRIEPPQNPHDDLGDKIVSIRVAADMPEAERTNLEILRSDRPVFDAYVEARRNRSDAFFYFRPDYVDVCQLPVPVRPVAE